MARDQILKCKILYGIKWNSQSQSHGSVEHCQTQYRVISSHNIQANTEVPIHG